MPRKNRVTVSEVEEALRKNGGFYSRTAKALGISTQAVANQINKSEHLQKVYDEIRRSFLDLAESGLVQALKNGERWAIKFMLEYQGKDRGYIKRQQVEGGDDDKPIRQKHQIEFIDVGDSDDKS